MHGGARHTNCAGVGKILEGRPKHDMVGLEDAVTHRAGLHELARVAPHYPRSGKYHILSRFHTGLWAREPRGRLLRALDGVRQAHVEFAREACFGCNPWLGQFFLDAIAHP